MARFAESFTLRQGDLTHEVGPGKRSLIIAEAGSNHDGDYDQAVALVEAAAKAGADAVKFQTFRAEEIYPAETEAVPYLAEIGITKRLAEIIAEMEMPYEWVAKLAEVAASNGIFFMSTPFDAKSLEELAPYVPAWKIASYELNHLPLIEQAAKTGKPVIISTGAATGYDEIELALDTLEKAGAREVAVLQCTAKYPAPIDSLNLSVIRTYIDRYGVPSGLSDHSLGAQPACQTAIAVGGSIVEKHFTLSRDLAGPDHAFAIEPDELAEMVTSIRETESALGSPEKTLHPVEADLRRYRRALCTRREIASGETIDADDLQILRSPGLDSELLEPVDISRVAGKPAARDLKVQTFLTAADVAGLLSAG